MLFVAHLNIVLGATSNFVIGEERAVPSIENVNLRKIQERISVSVTRPVPSPNVLCPLHNVSGVLMDSKHKGFYINGARHAEYSQ